MYNLINSSLNFIENKSNNTVIMLFAVCLYALFLMYHVIVSKVKIQELEEKNVILQNELDVKIKHLKDLQNKNAVLNRDNSFLLQKLNS